MVNEGTVSEKNSFHGCGRIFFFFQILATRGRRSISGKHAYLSRMHQGSAFLRFLSASRPLSPHKGQRSETEERKTLSARRWSTGKKSVFNSFPLLPTLGCNY